MRPFSGWPRSSSLGKRIRIFLPFQGTFFFNRGVMFGGARFVTLDGVRGFVGFAFGVPAAPFAPFGVLGLSIASISRLGDARAWPELSEESVLLRESIVGSVSDFSFSNAFSVSLLDCFRGRAWGASCALFCRLARGVRFSGNPSHAASSPENEPLSEEFSLPDPSLSQ